MDEDQDSTLLDRSLRGQVILLPCEEALLSRQLVVQQCERGRDLVAAKTLELDLVDDPAADCRASGRAAAGRMTDAAAPDLLQLQDPTTFHDPQKRLLRGKPPVL